MLCLSTSKFPPKLMKKIVTRGESQEHRGFGIHILRKGKGVVVHIGTSIPVLIQCNYAEHWEK